MFQKGSKLQKRRGRFDEKKQEEAKQTYREDG